MHKEVEGVRTDVRVLNYTLSGMAWYVEQLYNKIYESDKLAFTLDKSYYALGQDLNFAIASKRYYGTSRCFETHSKSK